VKRLRLSADPSQAQAADDFRRELRMLCQLRHRHVVQFLGRGLHSSTFRLNVSAFYRVGVALRVSLGGMLEVLEVIKVCAVCDLCQKRLGLS
jgi:hypothetical protein